jgi:hypothetical protein
LSESITYNVAFGSGDIYDLVTLDRIKHEYLLTTEKQCDRAMDIDPSYSLSKFAVLIWQKKDGKMFILKADQFERLSHTEMLNLIRNYIISFMVNRLRIDSSSPELIR